MHDLKYKRLAISVTILLGLLGLLWSNLFSILKYSHYNYIVELLGNKLIVILLLFLLTALLISIFYYRSLIKTIIDKSNKSIPQNFNSILKELKNYQKIIRNKSDKTINIKIDSPDDKKQLYSMYIKYYYRLSQINIYATMDLIHETSFSKNENITDRVINDLNTNYSEFIKTDEILSKCDKDILRSLPLYDLYISVRNSKDNIKSGDMLLEEFSYIDKIIEKS